MVKRKCKKCGKEFYVVPSRGGAKFCSMKCVDTKFKKNQVSIRKGIKLSDKTKQKISKNHANINGSNNPNWKGGKTKRVFCLRTSKRYKKWRIKVFKRDNYTCQKCYQYGGDLEAHHPIPVFKLVNTLFEKYIFNTDNGITFCKRCHKPKR